MIRPVRRAAPALNASVPQRDSAGSGREAGGGADGTPGSGVPLGDWGKTEVH